MCADLCKKFRQLVGMDTNVGDYVTAKPGHAGVVREVCGLGVWLDCNNPLLSSSFGNPVGVDWRDIID